MQIESLLPNSAAATRSNAGSRPSGPAAPLGEFESLLSRGESAAQTVYPPRDWKDFVAPGAEDLMGLPYLPSGRYGPSVAPALKHLDAKYRELLPKFAGIAFGPPVANYDPRLETLRLARAELKIEAMEEEGEFDKALDAFIGIHGLADSIGAAEKAELKTKLMKLATAALLENEWETAYVGAMTERIDVSIMGIRSFLFSEEDAVKTRLPGVGSPPGDPDLLAFLKAPRWQAFEVSLVDVARRAELLLASVDPLKPAEPEELGAPGPALDARRIGSSAP